MKHTAMYPGNMYSGAFLPILSEPKPGFQGCMGTIYERNPAIRDVLNTLQDRQRSDLRRTLVCAYVRRTDAAFVGGAQLSNLLSEMRSLLLKSDDRSLTDQRSWPRVRGCLGRPTCVDGDTTMGRP